MDVLRELVSCWKIAATGPSGAKITGPSGAHPAPVFPANFLPQIFFWTFLLRSFSDFGDSSLHARASTLATTTPWSHFVPRHPQPQVLDQRRYQKVSLASSPFHFAKLIPLELALLSVSIALVWHRVGVISIVGASTCSGLGSGKKLY